MPVTVRVQNFQSIQDATVEIDNFTVVTGRNNSGKTALLRAIRGVFQNTGGTAFIREGTKKTTVSVDFGDAKVQWSKGTTKRDRPTYIVNDGSPIHPGSSVPEEVEALGVFPINAGGRDVWPTIASQFTGQIFLLDRPGSALAEAVADVDRVTQLNGALRRSESDRRQTVAALKIRTSDLKEQEEVVASFHGLDTVADAVGGLTSKQDIARKTARAVLKLHALRDRIIKATADVNDLASIAGLEVPDPSVALKLRSEIHRISDLRDRLTDALRDEKQLKGVSTLMVDIDDAPSTRIRDALRVLGDLRERLSAARLRVVQMLTKLDVAEAGLVKAASVAETMLSEVGQCPLCSTVFAKKE